MNPVVRRMTLLSRGLRQCLCVQESSVKANEKGQVQTWVVTHFLSFIKWDPSSQSSQMSFLPWDPAFNLETLHSPKEVRISLFRKHIAPAYFEGRVEPRFGGGENAVNFVSLWSILASEETPLVLWAVSGAREASDRRALSSLSLPFDPSPSWSRDSQWCSEDHLHKVLSLWSLMVWFSICFGKGHLNTHITSFLLIVVYPTKFLCANRVGVNNAAEVIVGNHLAAGLCVQHTKTHSRVIWLGGQQHRGEPRRSPPPLPCLPFQKISLFPYFWHAGL